MKVMVVEDDRVIGEQVAESLVKWGFEVIAADNFDHVLQLFVKENPQLVLMDINLPSFDGFYWCNQIREISTVPILFLSSRNTPVDMVMAMNMGGDDFIQKPFFTEVLIAKINAILRRTYAYTENTLSVMEHDGIVLYPGEGYIGAGSKRVELTRTELTIMKLLMQHKGTVVNRKKIMRSLWEDESFVDDNTLTVNINRIRKKLAELKADSFISTRKGEGYIIS